MLVVGCSHPGIDKIVEAAAAINPKIHLIAGGFHLVVAPDDAIAKAVAALKDIFKVENVAPGHCTGEPTFAALKQAFGEPVHLCRRRDFTPVGIEHGRRRATWRAAGTRRGRSDHLSQARPPRGPVRPAGAESAITARLCRAPARGARPRRAAGAVRARRRGDRVIHCVSVCCPTNRRAMSAGSKEACLTVAYRRASYYQSFVFVCFD